MENGENSRKTKIGFLGLFSLPFLEYQQFRQLRLYGVRISWLGKHLALENDI